MTFENPQSYNLLMRISSISWSFNQSMVWTPFYVTWYMLKELEPKYEVFPSQYGQTSQINRHRTSIHRIVWGSILTGLGGCLTSDSFSSDETVLPQPSGPTPVSCGDCSQSPGGLLIHNVQPLIRESCKLWGGLLSPVYSPVWKISSDDWELTWLFSVFQLKPLCAVRAGEGAAVKHCLWKWIELNWKLWQMLPPRLAV